MAAGVLKTEQNRQMVQKNVCAFQVDGTKQHVTDPIAMITNQTQDH